MRRVGLAVAVLVVATGLVAVVVSRRALRGALNHAPAQLVAASTAGTSAAAPTTASPSPASVTWTTVSSGG